MKIGANYVVQLDNELFFKNQINSEDIHGRCNEDAQMEVDDDEIMNIFNSVKGSQKDKQMTTKILDPNRL